jgi:hypothetical protein
MVLPLSLATLHGYEVLMQTARVSGFNVDMSSWTFRLLPHCAMRTSLTDFVLQGLPSQQARLSLDIKQPLYSKIADERMMRREGVGK